MEEDGQVKTRLNVAQHEKRDEDETTHNGNWKNYAVLPRLKTEIKNC